MMTPMAAVPALLGLALLVFSGTRAVRAQSAETAPPDPVVLGIGAVAVALFAAVIGLSVFAKLLIVFGAVPREPQNGLHAIVHAVANVVGGLARPKPRRRPGSRIDER
jgi:membrane-bound ClpP family serine protease